MIPEYLYHGDKLTCPTLKKKPCSAVRRPDGKCRRSPLSTMLVEFENGIQHIILARTLRKIKPGNP